MMAEGSYQNRLIVTPLLDDRQIGPASIDIRLGSALVVGRRTYSEGHDVTASNLVPEHEARTFERINLPYFNRKSKFVLHPGELILAVTFEYFSVPQNIFATLASRSSWGRLGLVIATASIVQPGYQGALTLELANLADSPIALYPGLPVGQVIFHKTDSMGEKASTYKERGGRYVCPTEPEPPKFWRSGHDSELAFWGAET